MNIKFQSSLTGFACEVEGDTGVLGKRRVEELRQLAALIAQTDTEMSFQGYDDEPTVPGMDIAALVTWAIERGI